MSIYQLRKRSVYINKYVKVFDWRSLQKNLKKIISGNFVKSDCDAEIFIIFIVAKENYYFSIFTFAIILSYKNLQKSTNALFDVNF